MGEREPSPDHPTDIGAVAATSERLLVRLGLDLHDGALQQVHCLAQDVRLVREQVLLLVDNDHRRPVLGRFHDLESQLAELYRELRDLAQSLEPRSLLEQPLAQALAHELEGLERRSGISTSLRVDGDFEELTASQRIALLRVLQEALSNIRQHSGAETVSVTVAADDDGVRLDVRDDGRGFDPRATPSETDPEAGLGLAGMHERVRLLGGRLEVRSQSGGPTAVAAILPRWSLLGRPGDATSDRTSKLAGRR